MNWGRRAHKVSRDFEINSGIILGVNDDLGGTLTFRI